MYSSSSSVAPTSTKKAAPKKTKTSAVQKTATRLHFTCGVLPEKKSTTATRVAYVTSLLSVPHRPQRTPAENCGKEAAIAVRCQRKKEERAAKRAEEKDANKPQTKETRHSRHTVTRN